MPLEKDLTGNEQWVFDREVTANFEDMLERSIPQYEVMRQTVTDLAQSFMTGIPGSIVDLGSSRGDALAPLVARCQGEREFYAVECAPPMVEVLRQRFARPISEHWFRVVDQDLRETQGARWGHLHSVVLSILTLQFVPINYRQRIVSEAYRRLKSGGVFILVEKVLGETAGLDELMVSHYHALKGANGYGAEEIRRKAMSLEGVLVPVTAAWNLDLLRQAGFREVDCFWAWMNFRGWLAVKD